MAGAEESEIDSINEAMNESRRQVTMPSFGKVTPYINREKSVQFSPRSPIAFDPNVSPENPAGRSNENLISTAPKQNTPNQIEETETCKNQNLEVTVALKPNFFYQFLPI